jgi:hypothetical protein
MNRSGGTADDTLAGGWYAASEMPRLKAGIVSRPCFTGCNDKRFDT